jgi:hypothetical protein
MRSTMSIMTITMSMMTIMNMTTIMSMVTIMGRGGRMRIGRR